MLRMNDLFEIKSNNPSSSVMRRTVIINSFNLMFQFFIGYTSAPNKSLSATAINQTVCAVRRKFRKFVFSLEHRKMRIKHYYLPSQKIFIFKSICEMIYKCFIRYMMKSIHGLFYSNPYTRINFFSTFQSKNRNVSQIFSVLNYEILPFFKKT